jgi:hypothetical protein
MEGAATVEVSRVTQGERFVFVGGAPRSGTTLLQNMLDSHPAILGGPEFLHLVEIARLRSSMAASIRRGWISDFCSLEAMDRALAELVARLLLPLADRHGAALISEKTPHNVLVFEELLGLFPRARAIQVVRDPRAVVASMLEVGRKAKLRGVELQPFTRDVRAAVRHVKECFEAGCRAAELAPDRVLTVAYERLVASPAVEGRRICGFLGLPWDEAMLRPGEHPHIGLVPITEGSRNLWYDRASYQRNPEPASIDRWRTSMAARDKAVAVMAFRDFEPARRCGYPLTCRSLSRAEYAYGRAWTGLRAVKRLLAGRSAARPALPASPEGVT